VTDSDFFPVVAGGVTSKFAISDARTNLGLVVPSGRSVLGPAYTANNAVFNIKDFGAIGDGVADDTAAIQAALDACHAAGAGSVYAPAGTYLTGQINMPGDNIAVRGAGSGFVYGSGGTVRTVFKAKPGTTLVFNLVATGLVVDRAGCLLEDFAVDGNLIATYGIKVSGPNLLNRVKARGCLTAGCLLSDFTNSTHITKCAFVDNFGWGLQVIGAGTTVFSVTETNLSLNQLGGADCEAGFLPAFKNCVFESNSGPAVRLYHPDAGGAFGGFSFEDCWFEDNAATAGTFAVDVDAQTRSEARAPLHIKFKNCRLSSSVATRKHVRVLCGKWITFEDCNFDSSTASDTITLGAEARFVAFIESSTGYGVGLSATQLDNAIAQGVRCYASDREVKRVVGAGAPAPAFTNSWANIGSGSPVAQYWFDRRGNVRLQGRISAGAIGSSAFTLPVGYRPSVTMVFAVSSNGAFGEVVIQPTGVVIPNVGSNVSFNLNAISFSTD
jgi:hypothetical protein